MLHFGMTGALAWSGHPGPPGDHDRVRFVLDGGELRYRTQRKLGGVWWLVAKDTLEQVTGPLGPDAAELSRRDFRARLAGRRGGAKSALMDQELLAGLGNEMSDEILWRAGIAPRARLEALSRDRVDRLYDAMTRVLRETTRHGRIPTEGRWLGAVRTDPEARCPRCDTRLRREKAAGRTAPRCPRCQPGPGGG